MSSREQGQLRNVTDNGGSSRLPIPRGYFLRGSPWWAAQISQIFAARSLTRPARSVTSSPGLKRAHRRFAGAYRDGHHRQ